MSRPSVNARATCSTSPTCWARRSMPRPGKPRSRAPCCICWRATRRPRNRRHEEASSLRRIPADEQSRKEDRHSRRSRPAWGSRTMAMIANIVVGLIGLLHVYILVLEMFLWTKPAGLKAFNNTPERAEATAVLAANQGLYNGFLAAGLFWGLAHPTPVFGFQIKVFFLLCVLGAGPYAAAPASRKILFIQAVPATIGLVLLWLAA